MGHRFAILATVLALGFPTQSTASVSETPDSHRTETASADSVAADSTVAESVAADSTVAAESAADSTAADTTSVSIGLTRGDSTMTVARVESKAGFLRVIHLDGTEEYIPSHRIRWIKDGKGRDRTDHVLGWGKSLGDEPVSIRYASQPKSHSLRGRPLPFRKAFPVIQIGVLARLDTDPAHSDHSASVVFDIGGMKNVSQRWGVGGSIFFAGDDDLSRLGTKVRFRRWLGSDIAIDIAPGFLFSKDFSNSGSQYAPGIVGEVGVSLGDWVSLTGQVEAAHFERDTPYFIPTPFGGYYSDLGGDYTEVSWYAGGKFGGEAAMIAMLGTLLVSIALSFGATGGVF